MLQLLYFFVTVLLACSLGVQGPGFRELANTNLLYHAFSRQLVHGMTITAALAFALHNFSVISPTNLGISPTNQPTTLLITDVLLPCRYKCYSTIIKYYYATLSYQSANPLDLSTNIPKFRIL